MFFYEMHEHFLDHVINSFSKHAQPSVMHEHYLLTDKNISNIHEHIF